MSYVKSVLMPGERLVAVGKIHWVMYVRPVFFICAGLICFALMPVLGFVFFVMGCADLLGTVVRAMTTELAVTDRRVIAKFGFIRRNTIELSHRKVESMNVDQGMLGRLLNFGTLTIKGSGGTSTPIANIAEPLAFRSSALSVIEAPESRA